MKYYSEVLNKTFDSETECLEAETKYTEKKAKEEKQKELVNAKRKERAKEVEAAYDAVLEVQKKYAELRNKFIQDYGSWHMTISTPNAFSFLEDLFF